MSSAKHTALLAGALLLLFASPICRDAQPLANAQSSTDPAATEAHAAQGTGATDDANTPVRRIGGSVLPPKLDIHVEPQYSEQARKARFSGVVLIGLQVDEKGNPIHVHVIRGVGLGLDEKAMEAVKQYRFRPATENGTPVKVQLNIEVNFQIYDKPPAQ